MMKPEANVALCRALGVEPMPITCGCYAMEVMCDCAIAYPDLTSADVLMAALVARRVDARGLVQFGFMMSAQDCTVWGRAAVMSAERRADETCGSMLFRAACAAFGIECDA